MFWGLIMEPGRCYTQNVKVSFHVSMAALDVSNSSDDPAQVMCVFEGRNYLLCTLNKSKNYQCPLDLNFEAGSQVSFATNGNSHVHLTGYLTEEEPVEETDDEEPKGETLKQKKRVITATDGPPNKKAKPVIFNINEELEEESDDSDFDIAAAMEDSSSDNELVPEESGEDGDEWESDENASEEEVSSLSGEEAVEEEEEEVAPKTNGLSKKEAKQNKKEQNKKEQEKPTKKSKKVVEDQQKKKPKKSVLKGGVIVEELKEGQGAGAVSGKMVSVYYEGRLRDNNKLFDASTKGQGFRFRLGKGEVIKAWDIGVVGMKVGEKRRLVCPPNTAYGSKGSPPTIPPNSWLVFDVELKKIN